MYDISGLLDISGDVDGDMDGDDVLGELLGEILAGDSSDGDSSDGDMDGAEILSGLFRRRKRGNKKQRSQIARALLNKKVQDGKLLKQLRPNKWRRYPLGFVQLAVPAAGTVTVTATPQVPFKGQRLTIQASIAINFVINSLFVGQQNQFAGAGAVPAMTFTENAVGEDMNLDTAQIGNTLTMNVTNLDAANAHDFRANIMGDAVLMSA